MGTITDTNIATWQQKAGIEPAKAGAAERLCELSREAYDLIRIIELERSGIRDGDGSWHGSDPLGGTVLRMSELWQLFNRYREEPVTMVEGVGPVPF